MGEGAPVPGIVGFYCFLVCVLQIHQKTGIIAFGQLSLPEFGQMVLLLRA
jgi:hypothetical protein